MIAICQSLTSRNERFDAENKKQRRHEQEHGEEEPAKTNATSFQLNTA